ncbi:unnamed protein product [Paramecium primaurelia]|uniref:EML-like second beta-propeller domain-containing protein n=1 Tax=Paramecium primaurelia TaxID=5886 RepID=A0A8S1QS91_PARPR|nr:unnamed protein product [Paramecium primaurelia]
MNCTYHIQNQVSLICTAPHKCQCQRKLCAECQYQHKVDFKYTIPIKIFREMAIKKLSESLLDQTSELTKQRMYFKQVLSQTEGMMKKIWEEFAESIKLIYDLIEQKNKSYFDLLKENQNLSESSYSDLEKLVQIVEGKTLNDWTVQQNSYLIELDKAKRWWYQEVMTFIEKQNEGMKKNLSLIKINPYPKEGQVYQRKEDLYEILAGIQDIDGSIFNMIIEIMRKEKISDLLEFLSKTDNLKFHQSKINNQDKIFDITNNLRNIQDHHFSKNDYSQEIQQEERQALTNRIAQNRGIIEFLKFLVHLTAFDSKFIQSGSNALNLLVGMKVDLSSQCFENIRIKNTSLIGANLVRCNLSGSEFDNVEISGVNLNGAVLLNCKWKKIKINELNKLDGHTGAVWSVCISPDGKIVASGSYDKSIRLWDIKTGQQKAKLVGHTGTVWSVCISPDGNTLASGSQDNSIRLWDFKTGQQKGQLNGHTSTVLSLCFSPDGTTLASSSGDNSIRLWDMKTGQQIAKLEGHYSTVYSVSFSPDGTTLASGGWDSSIRLWDVKTGQQKAKLDGHISIVYSVSFSPDGTTLASSGWDCSIRLWDMKTGEQIAKIDGHTREVLSICFSPDGTLLASCSDDNSIRLWDFKTRKFKTELEGHTSWIQSVCFSPDGNQLASGSNDNSIRLWDVQTEKQKAEIDSHNNWSVFYSPDGTIIASSSYDKSIRLWNVRTGMEIQPFDNRYLDILAQFKQPLLQKNSLPNVKTHINTLLISQTTIFQAQAALILKGEFFNQSSIDLRSFFKQKGGFILDDQLEVLQ